MLFKVNHEDYTSEVLKNEPVSNIQIFELPRQNSLYQMWTVV